MSRQRTTRARPFSRRTHASTARYEPLSSSPRARTINDELFVVTQDDYSRLGRLMITVAAINLLPLLALPLLRRNEAALPRTPEGEREAA